MKFKFPTGQQPTLPQMQKVLKEMDVYMYCGHGSSLRNLTYQDIEKLYIRSVPLLFGCNSGRLERMGRFFDPVGTVHYYMIATAPCFLGFLWSVTDRDIDQWTVRLIEYWLDKSGDQRELVQAIADKKSDLDRVINRSAVVVYGLPNLKSS